VIPATLLGRLAVDSAHRGEGLGEYLLMDALYRAWTHSATIASFAVVVDAINEEARRFYARYEFRPFPKQERRLFLPMQKIQLLFPQ
jgi:GNAT superfamily N-acetyltransferase